jgi:hypothetical protein
MRRRDLFSHRVLSDGIVVYAKLNACCSACAPTGTTRQQIEEAVNAEFRRGQPYCVIEITKVRKGPPSPGPCNLHPDTRQHWFLMRRGDYLAR